MTYLGLLETAAHWAAIFTAAVASAAYCQYQLARVKRRRRLEDHLRKEKQKKVDRGQRTLLHLTANLAMTESEVLDAAFTSKLVVRRVKTGTDGQAETLLLQHGPDD